MKQRRLQQGKGALELVEEAFHLLRVSPASDLLHYYTGSLPFILGLLFFWADMSRSALAAQRVGTAALGLALLFLWMKAWQSLFAHRLLARLCGQPVPRWKLMRFLRAGLVQAIVQPSGFIVLPVALLLLVPFGWAYAFYQNITVLGAGESSDVRAIARSAWRQATQWPGQNNYALFYLKMFGLFVFVNLVSAFVAGPFLLKTVLGVETVFTRSWWAVMNPTFLAAMLGLTYLCLDPILKTLYVLRCFYGESLQSGQDLKTELKQHLSSPRLTVPGLVVLLLAWNASAAPGAGGGHPTSAPARMSQPETQPFIQPAELERAIADTISQREYGWRLPREKLLEDSANQSTLAALVENVFETLGDWARSVGRWLERVVKWLTRNRQPPVPSSGSGDAWLARLHWLLVLLVVALVVVLASMVFRMWRSRRRRRQEVAAEVVLPAPDLADESVGADQLPEDGWTQLARELLQKGELRLALRAFYLASLAHLAEHDLITLAKFKSNHEYENELDRRSHALPELTVRFRENVSVFDRVWYGLHEVEPGMLDLFTRNVEIIKTQT